ncbi:MAG TPA: protoglobin domain-containing protein [Kofleriaceae bacterium]|nr:protoglobin domain-containing protein [Kofleriaceae bacterium]
MTFFDEIKDYVGFGEDDAAALRALRPLLEPRFVALAEHHYTAILRHPRAAAAITGGAQQVARLKQTLVAWLDSALAGPHDQAYYQRRARIGRIHVVIGLPQEYMFTAMNVMRVDVHHAIDDLAPDGAAAMRDAVDKLFDLELAIMLRHYQSDSEAKLVQRERTNLDDRLSAMRTLTAGLAHEVRNPLNAAKLQLELLERRLKKGAEDERLLEGTRLVHHEIQRLTELLQEFLDFARPAQLVAGEHDLVAIAQHVIELQRARADARDVELELTRSTPVVHAWCDGARIHQVIFNLVQNALEAVPDGGTVELRVAGAVGGGAVITIIDNGGGIPPDVLARIYEPFFSTKEGGTGLGMAIVHSLVELHRGAIEIATGAGGTEISVKLPPRP